MHNRISCGEIRYVYDDIGQLIREDNSLLNATYVYTYDNAGNILSKSTYALMLGGVTPTNPTDTVVCTYPSQEGVWGDLLISYDGVSFTYDQIGNPLSYYNGNNYTFTWLGRQLASAAVGGKTYTYTYNDAGIRASKTVDGVTTTYYYDGNLLISEQTPTYTIIYIYDANGSPIGMQYRLNTYAADTWDVYWFEKNLQGDIVAVYDATGTKLVSCIYDAWGNLNITYHNGGANTGAAKNPFTYRGYYYDWDIGFYYLQSRYYDPLVGRFINADSEIAGANGDLQGYNMFAYCFNNPVNMCDSMGNWPQWIEDVANWVNNNIILPIANFFSSSTNTISGQFQDGIIQGSGSLTGGYSEVMFRGQTNQQAIPVTKEASTTIGAFGKISGGNASGKIGVGNANLSVFAKGVADVLTATGQAGLIYKDGLGIKLKAKAAVATGRATFEFNVFDCQIEFGVYGDALAIGAEATIGIFEGGFEAKAGASVLFGGGFVFRVKPVQ